MPWIQVIDENSAEGELKEAYNRVSGSRGKISNVMRVQSLDPKSMSAHLDLYLSVMFGNVGISRERKEMIGVVVSAVNECEYCINHHAIALNHYWKDEDRVVGLAQNHLTFELPEKDRAMIDYAIKLTKTPASMTEGDVEKLWTVGFTDEEILNINMITGYFNFVNRLVLGLGVEFSESEAKGYKY